MPITIKYLNDGEGVVLKGCGNCGAIDFFAMQRDLFNRELSKGCAIKYVFCDYSEVESIDSPSQSFVDIADQANTETKFKRETLMAMVGSSDLMFGVERVFSSYLDKENWEVMVFRCRNNAYNWLRERVKEKYGGDIGFK